MKKIIIFCIVLAVLGSGYLLLSRQTEHRYAENREVYYCPMHPRIVRDRPGECPICHMTLVKRMSATSAVSETDAHSTHNSQGIVDHVSITLTDSQRQLMGIRTTTVDRRPLIKTVRAFGYVAQNIEMYTIQNEFVDAFVDYVLAFRDYRRIKDRRRRWETHRKLQTQILELRSRLLELGLNESGIDRLQQVDYTEIWDQPEIRMFEVNRNYWVIANIFEDDLGFVDVGQPVDVELTAYHEKTPGIVRSVAGSVDPKTRLIRVLVELTEYKGELAERMLAYATMPVELTAALAVPREAVMDLGTRKIVFVEKEKGVFEPREISVAWYAGGYWSVKDGLQAGETVAVDGNFFLDSESRLQANFQQSGSSPEGGQSHVH